MRLHSKLRSALILTAALSSSAQIALPVLAQGTIAPAKVDSGSYGPVVTIVSPEYSDVIKGDTQIEIAIAPRKYPAQSVELLVDGRSVSGVLPVQTKFAWKTEMFIDGPHTLGVRVTDIQGFIGQSETTVYVNNQSKIDNDSPILRWLGINSGDTLSGVTKFRLEAADDFGVKYVFLNLNTAISPDIKPPLASWMTNRPPYEFSLDTAKFKDGMYVLDAYAWDANDNERNALRLAVKFLNQAAADAPEAQPTPAPTPYIPPEIPTSINDSAAKPPVALPSYTLPATQRNPVMTSEPATVTFSAPSPLQNTNAAPAARTSRPPGTMRILPNAVKTEPQETEKTPNSETPNAEGTRVVINPQFPARGAGTPALSSIEKVLRGRTTQIASTPANASVPERRARKPILLATAPGTSTRVALTIATPVTPTSTGQTSGTSIAPEITVSAQQQDPDAVSVVISSSESNSTRIESERGVLPTSPGMGTRIAQSAPSANPAQFAPSVEFAPSGSTPSTGISTSQIQEMEALPFGREIRGFQVTKPEAATRIAAVETKNRNNNNANSSDANSENPFLTTHQGSDSSGASDASSTRPSSGTGSEQNFAQRTVVEQRITRPLIAVLPQLAPAHPNSRPQLSASPDSPSISPIAPIQSRIAEPHFTAPTKMTGSSSLPTLPRLAVLPEIKWNDKAATTNAITIAPIAAKPLHYTATSDETLAAIAARYKMPVSVLAESNKLPQNARIAKGTRVLLPQTLMLSYKGQNITGDVAPLLIGSTSVAPFRFLFEKQGGKMTWDAAGQRVTARNGSYEVSLEIGSDKAIVNQEEVLMDMAAFLLSGRTMVPVRFFEKALHAKVEWEPSTGRIFVAMNSADS